MTHETTKRGSCVNETQFDIICTSKTFKNHIQIIFKFIIIDKGGGGGSHFVMVRDMADKGRIKNA